MLVARLTALLCIIGLRAPPRAAFVVPPPGFEPGTAG